MGELDIIIMVMQEFELAGIVAATQAAANLLGIDTHTALEWACKINNFETALRLA